MSWKKMLQAFGRAAGDYTGAQAPGEIGKHLRYKYGDYDNYKKGVRESQEINERGIDAQPEHLMEIAGPESEHYETLNIGKVDAPTRRIERFADVEHDKRATARLQNDFDEAFDSAVKQHVSEDPKRSEDEVRKEAINMLKSGTSIQDVLDILRGFTK